MARSMLGAMEEDPVAAQVESKSTVGSAGSASAEESRSRRLLVAGGRSGPIGSPLESIIGTDERVRILDTELSPWRRICALRIRAPSGGIALGTGWFVGPKTVLTAGPCVYSGRLLGGWADTIEVIPGLIGSGPAATMRPFGSVTSSRFSAIQSWVEQEDTDFDIGCIHLDEPLGDTVGWFALGVRSAEELTGSMVNISGYPDDRGNGNEQYHAVNRVLQVSDRRIFFELDMFGGQNGAPVWIQDVPDGAPVAVGIQTPGVGDTQGMFANSAPRLVPELFDIVEGWIEQDGGLPKA
jgi:glutamyl endopeptidase